MYSKILGGDFSRILHTYDAQVNVGLSGEIIVHGGFLLKNMTCWKEIE